MFRLAAPTAMHRHVATMFVKINTDTNFRRFQSPPSFKPIIPYEKNPKKNGGNMRIGSKSKSSILTK